MITFLLTRFAAAGDECSFTKPSFFGLPTWYQYLPGKSDLIDPNKCIPSIADINHLTQILGIGLALIDILLHLAGLIAVGFVIYGAFLYMTSQGEPDKINAAKNTLLNAIIGLVIVMIATGAVVYIGGKLS